MPLLNVPFDRRWNRHARPFTMWRRRHQHYGPVTLFAMSYRMLPRSLDSANGTPSLN
jgi:hypothetical protein